MSKKAVPQSKAKVARKRKSIVNSMLQSVTATRQTTESYPYAQSNHGFVDPSDPKSWLSHVPLMLFDVMPLELQGCPMSQCSTTELKAVRQLMQHHRNVHTVRTKKVLPSIYDEESFDKYLERHGACRYGKRNALYVTLPAKTERKEGVLRLKYSSCRKCGPYATPVYKLPPQHVFETPSTCVPRKFSSRNLRAAQQSVIDLTAPAIDATQPPSRILPVFSDLKELLDSLALAWWDVAPSSSRGHPLSKFHLDAGDLPTLRKGKWLSSVIVDCFAEQINATQRPIKSLNTLDAHMFSVHLNAFLATKKDNYSNVSRWVRSARIDWPSTSHTLIPVHETRNTMCWWM